MQISGFQKIQYEPLPKDKHRADILGTAQHNGPCEELHGEEIMVNLRNDLSICSTVFSVINILSDYRLEMLRGEI